MDKDDLIPCMYDKTHMIRRSRMPYHLNDCKRNFLGVEHAVCQFDATHHVPKPELRYHEANCDQRFRIEKELLHRSKVRHSTEPTNNVVMETWEKPPESKEDWNTEVPFQDTFGVNANLLKSHYRSPEHFSGMTPAQKKAFIQKFKEEIQQKKNDLPFLDEEEEEVKDEGPLQLPNRMPQAFQKNATGNGLAPTDTAVSSTADNLPKVFAASLNVAGLGRGRGTLSFMNPQDSLPPSSSVVRGQKSGRIAANIYQDSQSPETYQVQLLQNMCRGRGVRIESPIRSQNNQDTPPVGFGRGVAIVKEPESIPNVFN